MVCRARNQGGFTLIELMITIAIIGVLAAIAIPNYISYRNRALVARAQADLKTIEKAVTMLALDTGLYPSKKPVGEFLGGPEESELNGPEYGLTDADDDFLDAGWAGPYIREVPKDPWGNDYWFDNDWHNNEDGWDYVAIGSCGPNGVGLNDYDDPDNIVLIISEPFEDP